MKMKGGGSVSKAKESALTLVFWAVDTRSLPKSWKSQNGKKFSNLLCRSFVHHTARLNTTINKTGIAPWLSSFGSKRETREMMMKLFDLLKLVRKAESCRNPGIPNQGSCSRMIRGSSAIGGGVKNASEDGRE